MVTSSALVGSSSTTTFGLHDQRARDGDALALAARELVRIAVQQRLGLPPSVRPTSSSACTMRARRAAASSSGLVDLQAFADDLLDRQARRERRERVLEHHLDLAPQMRAALCRRVLPRRAADADLALARPSGRARASASVVLPEPGLADHAERLARARASKSTVSTAVKRPLRNQPRMPGSRVG